MRPSLFQQLVKGCLGKTVDLSIYDENRKLRYTPLTEYGFEAVYPDGAFYLFLKSPEPADSFGYPGYVRIAYCVTTEQIRCSLPAFRKLADLYIGE